MKLLIISICHDEEDSVAELLDRMPERVDGFDEIERLVVSDGSSDGTARIARDHGADVVEGPTQQRLAFRFEQAIQLALERGADVAVNIDGDLQFRPEDIPLLVEPIVAGRADFVAGDRFSDSQTGAARRPDGMPASKYRANRLGSWVVSRLSAAEFPDVTCGFRAYSRAAMLQLNINNKYTYTQESFQLLAMKKVAIETIPVHVTYHEERRSRVVTNFWSFLLNSGLNIMRAFRDFAPLRFFFFLGLFPFVLGGAMSIFVGVHWLRTDAISPYRAFGIVGVYLVSLGLIAWLLGLVADMLNRNNKNQEKLLAHLKELRFPEKRGDRHD